MDHDVDAEAIRMTRAHARLAPVKRSIILQLLHVSPFGLLKGLISTTGVALMILSRRAALMKAALAGAGVLALTSVAHADAEPEVEPGPEAEAAPEVVEEPQVCLSIAIDPEPEACSAAHRGEVDGRWLAVPAAIVVAKQLSNT